MFFTSIIALAKKVKRLRKKTVAETLATARRKGNENVMSTQKNVSQPVPGSDAAPCIPASALHLAVIARSISSSENVAMSINCVIMNVM